MFYLSYIKTMLPPAFLLFLVAVTLIGCSSSTAKKDAGSSAYPVAKTTYKPQQDVSVFGADTTKLSGFYTGFYHCPNISMQFTFDIQKVDEGQVSGELVRTILNDNPNLRRIKTKTIRVPFRGYYDPISSRLSLKVQPTREAGLFMYYKMATLSGIVMPDASKFVLFDSFPTSMECTAWVAKKGKTPAAEWQYITDEIKPGEKAGIFDRLWGGFDPAKARKEDQVRKQCPDNIYRWLLQTDKAPKRRSSGSLDYVRIMYSDRHFVPYFGKPFSELSKEERLQLSIPMRGSCVRDTRLRSVGAGLVNHVTESFANGNYIPDVDKVISATAYNMTYSWLDQAEQHFVHMAKNTGSPDKVKTFLRGTDKLLNRIFPDEKENFVSYADQQYRAMIIPVLAINMDTELAAAKPTMLSLNALAGFEARSIERYPEVDRKALSDLIQKIDVKVNADAPSAAQTFALSLQGVDGFVAMQTWSSDFHYLNARLDKSALKKLEGAFLQRQQQLAAEILKKEKMAFQQQIVDLKASPNAIKAGADYEKRFQRQYQMLATMPGYRAFADDRNKQRSLTFKQSEVAFTAMLRKQPHESSLKRIELNYFIDGDSQLSGAKNIFVEYNRSYKKVAPFESGSLFDLYMNALYTYDENYLRDIDQRSIAPILQSMQGLQPMMDIAGILIGIFSGDASLGKKVVKSEMIEAKEMSLIQPMMAFYVLNYEKYNGKCIESDAKSFQMTTRWTEYTGSGGFRYETGRTEYKTYYKINQRFIPIFEQEYKNDGDSATAKFSDRFFQGKGKIYRDELIKGTVKFMNRGCDSGLVRRMEENMIRYYSFVQARTQKAKRDVWQ